ncbi:Phosphoserine phosphatase RsbU [Posidoniimonas polymericola]|uniref:Phosphoserine phosphatase RsbU n=1 Tax=Posidoniimonas polymericola TaxID=2528002 RepID=A0A5C5YUQ5_9BACT|nr:SpoIIE family protein phosphatase [Posidoniimonas polymericola]TWT78551.1 Phosphoserine phosphatase RsbU [Posidoniimonas polymericola]
MLNRLPIKILAPLLFAAPVLALGLYLSHNWNQQSQDAINELADRYIEQIHDATAEKITDVLSMPLRVCQVNEHLIANATLPPGDLASWRQTFVEEARAFDMLSSIAWGDADGRAAWVTRYADGRHYWAIKEDGSAPTMLEWRLDDAGGPVEDAQNKFDFQVETRPWFKTPRDAGRDSWSEPYVWVGGGEADEPTLGISFGIPIMSDGRFVGVVDADFSLNDLSRYLGSLKVGKSGVALLVSRDARLLATSDGSPVVSAEAEQIKLGESKSPLINAAALLASDQVEADGARTRVEIEGEDHYLRASRVGEAVGLDWLLLTVIPQRDFLGDIEDEFASSWITSLIAVALAVALGLAAARWLVAPLTRLMTSVRRIGQGDLETRIAIRHAPEYELLASEINKMAEGLQDRIRMQKSLSLAMEVQRNLLPADAPALRGLDIAGHSTYCDETGGDYFDFLDLSGADDDTAVIVIGDVMGHGVAAALLMATARGILRSRCEAPGSLADFLGHLNEMLVVDTQGERFMTMLLVTLSGDRDELRWASAGHGPPLVYDPSTDTFAELDGGGLPLGLMEGEEYEEHVLAGVRPGSVVLTTTDGLEETINQSEELYGTDRLRELVRKHAGASAEEISQAIRDSLANYRGDLSQDDDLTFVVAKVC